MEYMDWEASAKIEDMVGKVFTRVSGRVYLVTGWVTAAGGAWNASIVSEYVSYQGHPLIARGLGALISESTSHGEYARLVACLLVMVAVVVLVNRLFWNRVYHVAETRYRFER